MAGTGISQPVLAKILHHVEPGVPAVYDRHSYDRENREALDAWAARLLEIAADSAVIESTPDPEAEACMTERATVVR